MDHQPIARRFPLRRGATLFELILALSLTVLLLGAITLAVRLNLRSLDARRADVEEAQLARAVLRMVADDLHSAVQHEVVDFSPLEAMASSSAVAAAAAAASNADGAATGSTPTGGASSGGASSGGSSKGTTTTKTTTTTTKTTTTPSAGKGGGSGGSTASSTTKTTTTSSTTKSSTSGSSSSSAPKTSGSPSTGGGGTGGSSSADSSSDPSQNTQDIAQTTTPPPIPGLYGNQYELQIDVCRLPRLDQYQPNTAGGGAVVGDIPSAVKTVAYYVRGQGSAPLNTGFSAPGQLATQDASRPGLVRRQLDRAVTLQASSDGSSASLNQQGDLIAPEVVSIEFRYFDGTEWLTCWDSDQQQGLPLAVEILVALQPSLAYADASTGTTLAAKAVNSTPKMFRHVVRLPGGKLPSDLQLTDGTSTGTSTGTSGATGSTSSGGSTPTGGSK